MEPMTIMYVFLGLCVVATIPAIVMMIRDAVTMVQNANWDYKETPGIAKVVNKVRIPSYSTSEFIPMGKMVFPHTRRHPEEFKVYVNWDGKEYEISDELLFQKSKVGGTVPVTIHVGYDKAGVARNTYITR